MRVITSLSLVAALSFSSLVASATSLTRTFTVTGSGFFYPDPVHSGTIPPTAPFDPYTATFSVTYDPAAVPTIGIDANGDSFDYLSIAVTNSPEPVAAMYAAYYPQYQLLDTRPVMSPTNLGDVFFAGITDPFSASPYFINYNPYGASDQRYTLDYFYQANQTEWANTYATLTFVDAVPTSTPEPASILVLLAAIVPSTLSRLAPRRHASE